MATTEKRRSPIAKEDSANRYRAKIAEITKRVGRSVTLGAMGGLATGMILGRLYFGPLDLSIQNNNITYGRELYYTQAYETFPDKYQSSELKFEIQARKIKDANWIEYEANGLTNKGWWAQAGLHYEQKNDKFGLMYEIWDVNGKSINPESGGHGIIFFKKQPREGDPIIIKITQKNDTTNIEATNPKTKEIVSIKLPCEGDFFVGDEDNPYGYITNFMTETVSYKPGIPTEPRVVYKNLTTPKPTKIILGQSIFTDKQQQFSKGNIKQERVPGSLKAYLSNADSSITFLEPDPLSYHIKQAGSPEEFITGGK